jgi:hypothetical protein
LIMKKDTAPVIVDGRHKKNSVRIVGRAGPQSILIHYVKRRCLLDFRIMSFI